MILSQPVVELLRGNSWKKLPYPWIQPTSDLVFWIVFIFQAIGLYYSHCLAVAIASFSPITIQMTAMFDVLLLSISRIDDRRAAKMKALRLDSRAAIYECLRDDIELHVQLVREWSLASIYLQRSFSAISMVISMIMACEAYPLVMGNCTPGEFIKGVIFLSVQVICWSQGCQWIEIMSDQNTAVFQAVYGTPWYENGPRYKKLMLNTLTFSKEPLYIKSLIFTGMSATMSTFYSFVVSSFNLLNMIRNLK